MKDDYINSPAEKAIKNEGILLFFRPTGTEYAYEKTTEKWKRVRFGSFAVEIVNLLMDATTAEERGDLPFRDGVLLRLEAFTGEKGEESVVKALSPVLMISKLSRYKGETYTQKKLEALLPGWWAIWFLMGQQEELWFRWLEGSPVPAYEEGLGLGWKVRVPTFNHAAIIETGLGLMHGWRGKFAVCKYCYHLFYGRGESCKDCQGRRKGERKDVDNFKLLLRQHKTQLKKGRLKKLLKAKEAVEAIGSYITDLKRGQPLERVIKDYAFTCKKLNLPTKWVSSYSHLM